MGEENIERRLSTLEANQVNTDKTIDAIWKYMQEGRAWRDQATASLAILTNNQADCKDHEKRITAIEGFQRRAIKFATAAAASIAVIVETAKSLAEWIKH
jgi:uncharacterized coiled-coil protein SlyX